MMCRALVMIFCLFALVSGAEAGTHEANHDEYAPQFLPLQGALLEPAAEISGLAWHGQRLLLLPQYPDFATDKRHMPAALFAIARQDILRWLHGTASGPLPYAEIAVQGMEGCRNLPGFEGFEAIAVEDGRAWLLVEARHKGRMRAWLVPASFKQTASGDTQLHLDAASSAELPMPANLRNAGYETLVLGAGQLLAVFEGNGANVTPEPFALAFDTSQPLSQGPEKIPFPNVEYRITDGTALQTSGGVPFFWAMNYFWPGEKKTYRPAPDPLVARYGQGPTHARSDAVERVLRFDLQKERVTLADAPPLLLKLGMLPRNWEGLALLETNSSRGLLLATDKFPGTLLAFVPLPRQ